MSARVTPELTAAALLAILSDELEAIRATPDITAAERARCVANLCAVALRCVEQATYADRLAALERAVREAA